LGKEGREREGTGGGGERERDGREGKEGRVGERERWMERVKGRGGNRPSFERN